MESEAIERTTLSVAAAGSGSFSSSVSKCSESESLKGTGLSVALEASTTKSFEKSPTGNFFKFRVNESSGVTPAE